MIIQINGRRRQGKTTLAYRLAMKKPTRVIFDPRRMFNTTSVVITDPVGLYDLMDTESEIIVQPEGDLKDSFDIFSENFQDWTEDNPQEDCALIVDEVRFLDTPNRNYVHFDKTLRFTESDRVQVYLTSHRPSDTEVGIRAITDYWVIFRTTQENDLKVVDQRCGPEVAEIVCTLPNKHYLVWDDGEARYRVESDPTKWFVDIKVRNEVKVTA